MVDLESLEMADLGEMEQFELEGVDGEDLFFETALNGELEGLDGEFEGLSEAGMDPELEGEGWFETQDLETDPFLGNLIRRVGQNIQGGVTPELLRSLAQQAAQVAGAAVAGRTGANIAGQIANQVLREGDLEGEGWYETDPLMEVDAGLMEELHYNAAMAAEAESEAAADQFIGAIANLAGPLLGSLLGETGDPLYEEGFGENDLEYAALGERDEFFPLLAGLAKPLLKKGIGAIGKALIRRRATRRLVRTLPRVAAGAARDLSRLRRRATPRDVAVALARRTARTFGNPAVVARAIRQNRTIAQRAQSRPAFGGTAWRPATRRYPIYSGFAPGRRRRVVGYILRPIYAAPRVRV